MTNYIKLFADENAYSAFTATTAYVTPNVSVCSGGSHSIFYNPLENHDYSKNYLTFIPKSEGTFSINGNGSGTTSNTISYSIGDGAWTNIAYGVQTPTVQAGEKIRFKGTPDASYTEGWKSIGTFQCTTSFDAEGNAMSMTHGDNFQSDTAMESECELAGLFQNSSIISAENLVLPATSLTFGCYNAMFYGCTSLTTSPELPATTLAQGCYGNMFNTCTGLTTAPELPANTLAEYCYFGMFQGCRSLTTAPVLPATTLAEYCYSYMFEGCTSLNSITCLATDISAENCTSYWVSDVASSGTFTKAASMEGWTTGVNGIPSSWTVLNK